MERDQAEPRSVTFPLPRLQGTQNRRVGGQGARSGFTAAGAEGWESWCPPHMEHRLCPTCSLDPQREQAAPAPETLRVQEETEKSREVRILAWWRYLPVLPGEKGTHSKQREHLRGLLR